MRPKVDPTSHRSSNGPDGAVGETSLEVQLQQLGNRIAAARREMRSSKSPQITPGHLADSLLGRSSHIGYKAKTASIDFV